MACFTQIRSISYSIITKVLPPYKYIGLGIFEGIISPKLGILADLLSRKYYLYTNIYQNNPKITEI